MLGPNVVIATANHPIDGELRGKGLQYNKDVYIGENAWIGAGVIIVPGISIDKYGFGISTGVLNLVKYVMKVSGEIGSVNNQTDFIMPY